LKLSKAQSRLWADLSLLVVTAVWGGTFVMVKEALALAEPFTFLAARFVLATLVVLPAVMLNRAKLSAGAVRAGVLAGCLLAAGYGFQTVGLLFTTASKAAFITGLSVVIVPLISAMLSRRPPARPTTAGIALATFGLALVSLSDDLSIQPGDLLVLGCAVSFALHILVVGRYAARYDTLALTASQIAATGLFCSAFALLFESPRAEQISGILPAAIFTGLFATVAAFYLQTLAQRFTTPTHTALIFSMEPVFGAFFGYLLAGERLGPRPLIGCGMILLGMLVAQLAPEHEQPAHEPFG
jgi:drug/metabolite transporter (DMT)-like permease